MATLNEIQSDMKTIYKKLLYLEQRVNSIEKVYQKKSNDDIDIPAASSGNPYIRNEGLLYVIMKKKFKEITKGKLSIKNVSINDLYESIIKDYSITREIFAEYLLILYNRQKIQLEPGFKNSEFSIRDLNGNSFNFVSILE